MIENIVFMEGLDMELSCVFEEAPGSDMTGLTLDKAVYNSKTIPTENAF